MSFAGMGFTGIPAGGFAFLREIAAEQNKVWYEANKKRHEASLRQPVARLVEALAETFEIRKIPLEGDAKRSLYRIHRDTRFSKDKTPYKTHAGAILFRPGAGKDGNGVLYVHIAPRDCFAAAAFYMPEPPAIGAIRAAIRRRPETWLDVEAKLAEAGLTLGAGDPLTRMPRGFEDMADTPIAEALRRRSHIARIGLTQKELGGAAVIERIADFAAGALPLLKFGWQAIDEAEDREPRSRLARFLPAGE